MELGAVCDGMNLRDSLGEGVYRRIVRPLHDVFESL